MNIWWLPLDEDNGAIKQYHIIIGDHDRKRAKRVLFFFCLFFPRKELSLSIISDGLYP